MGKLGKGKFGWSYPAGCSGPPDGEMACEVCGHEAGSCICPECPKCGATGDPRCYMKPAPIFCGGLHGKMTIEQQIDGLRADVARCEEELLEDKRRLEELEMTKACRDHSEKSGIKCPYPDFCGFDQPCLEGCPGGIIDALKTKEKGL